MKALRYIFVSLLMATGLSSPIPLDKTTSNEFNEYFAAKVQLCVDQNPAKHGLLIYLQQSSPERISSESEQNDEGSGFQKRFIKSLYKTVKGMPAEQRIAVMSTMVSAYTLPAYMTSAAQSWDTEQISNIKSKAAEMEVKKSKGSKIISKPKKNPRMLPPPSLLVGHMKRSFAKRSIDLKKLPKTNSFSKTVLHSSHGSGSSRALEAAGMLSPHHSSLSRQAASVHSSTVKPEPKKPKQANPTVNKVLTWVGGSIQLLYIPVGWMTTHKVQRVTDDDTHSYRKRNFNIHANQQFPIITCIPISQRGKNDSIIPKGALL